jgi:hypothetical protein
MGESQSQDKKGGELGTAINAIFHLACQSWSIGKKLPTGPLEGLRLRAHEPGAGRSEDRGSQKVGHNIVGYHDP